MKTKREQCTCRICGKPATCIYELCSEHSTPLWEWLCDNDFPPTSEYPPFNPCEDKVKQLEMFEEADKG